MIRLFSKIEKSWRAFTLVEVMVAMIIISILLVSGLGITRHYLQQNAWDTLFQRLERSFQDVNVYALAGFSAGFAESGEQVAELPEMYHLYFESGRDGGAIWYFETRRQDPEGSATKRHISYQDYIEFPVNRILMEKVELYADHTGGGQQTESNVLLTWKNPFAQLSFQPVATELSKAVGDNTLLESEFDLPADYSGCQNNPDECSMTIIYEREGSTERRQITIDLQKGVSSGPLLRD